MEKNEIRKNNIQYIERYLPAIKKNFNLEYPDMDFERIENFTKFWSDEMKNEPQNFFGLYHCLFYNN